MVVIVNVLGCTCNIILDGSSPGKYWLLYRYVDGRCLYSISVEIKTFILYYRDITCYMYILSIYHVDCTGCFYTSVFVLVGDIYIYIYIYSTVGAIVN